MSKLAKGQKNYGFSIILLLFYNTFLPLQNQAFIKFNTKRDNYFSAIIFAMHYFNKNFKIFGQFLGAKIPVVNVDLLIFIETHFQQLCLISVKKLNIAKFLK